MKPTFKLFFYFLITSLSQIIYGKSISTNLVLSSVTPIPNDVIFQWPQYTFKVDFKDTISNIDSTQHINSDGVMAIALYTNKSFLGGDCSNYLPFNCSEYNCFPSQEKQRGLSHPYFEFEGYTLHTELYMDYTFFANPSMNLIYAQKCSDNMDMTPQKIHGMLGLGLEGSGINNFMGQYPTFSIFLEEDSPKGELIFDCDARKINETGLHQNVVSTKNWEVPYQDIRFHEKSFKISGTTIFDINLPYIGLPAVVYEAILKNLKEKFNVTCESPLPLHRRKCIFKGNFSDLPDIKLEPEITIPPQVYLKHTKNYNYKLNLIALSLDPEKTQPYIKVIQNFKKHVILGAPFMQYYYVCFEAKPKHCEINIYEKDSITGYDAKLMFILRVVGAVMIPFVLCIIFCCLSRRKEKKDTSDYQEIILKDEAGISRAFLSKEEVSVDFECVVEDGDLDAEKDDLKKVRSEELLSTQVDSKLDQGLDSLVLP